MAETNQTDTVSVDNTIPPELEDALQRVMLSETLVFSKSLSRFNNLKKCQNSLKAIKLLANRELIEASKFNEEEESSLSEDMLEELRIQGREIRDQLYKAFLKHATVSDTLQNITFLTQIQNNFYETLEKDDAENDPSIISMLTNANDNVNASSDLVKKIEEQVQLKQDIFELQVKYRETLQSIEQKWKIVSGQEPPDSKYRADKAYQELEVKLQRREERLSIIVGLLQGLISGSGEIWGKNPRLIQILLLCDASYGPLEDSLAVQESIEELKKIRKKPQGPIDTYVTSTPMPK